MPSSQDFEKFYTAIVNNNVQMANDLIIDFNVNSHLKHRHEFPLHLSIINGHLEMVEFLLSRGAAINIPNKEGFHPLHLSCSYLNPKIARLLIKNGAQVNAYSTTRRTPLLIAASMLSLELIEILVESGANLELCDKDNNSALNLACQMASSPESYKVIEYLISKGANVRTVNALNRSPLLTTLAGSSLIINLAVVKLLLRNGADPNQIDSSGNTALMAAIRRSSEHLTEAAETVQSLIDHGCDINATVQPPIPPLFIPDLRYFEKPLWLSIKRNQDHITEKLIRQGANLMEKDFAGNIPFIELLNRHKFELARQALAVTAYISKDNMDIIFEIFHQIHLQISRMNIQITVKDFRNFKEIFDFITDSTIFKIKGLSSEETKLLILHLSVIKHEPDQHYFIPRLTHLCRCSFRKWYGNRADHIIQNNLPSNYPPFLRQYLLMIHL